ncbi:MAG: HPF/RaiA family ribosome-associated protein [Parcubacteria group bacterium]|jgi:ribosomal subunit interface protein
MNIRYLFRETKVDDREREYIEKKLKPLNKLLSNILQIEIEIDLEKKGKFRIELMICTPYKKYRVEEISESIEGAIDGAAADIKDQIIKDKGKIKTLKKRGRISLKKKLVLDEKARF